MAAHLALDLDVLAGPAVGEHHHLEAPELGLRSKPDASVQLSLCDFERRGDRERGVVDARCTNYEGRRRVG